MWSACDLHAYISCTLHCNMHTLDMQQTLMGCRLGWLCRTEWRPIPLRPSGPDLECVMWGAHTRSDLRSQAGHTHCTYKSWIYPRTYWNYLSCRSALLTSSANNMTKFGFDSLIFCVDPETWPIASTANSQVFIREGMMQTWSCHLNARTTQIVDGKGRQKHKSTQEWFPQTILHHIK